MSFDAYAIEDNLDDLFGGPAPSPGSMFPPDTALPDDIDFDLFGPSPKDAFSIFDEPTTSKLPEVTASEQQPPPPTYEEASTSQHQLVAPELRAPPPLTLPPIAVETPARQPGLTMQETRELPSLTLPPLAVPGSLGLQSVEPSALWLNPVLAPPSDDEFAAMLAAVEDPSIVPQAYALPNAGSVFPLSPEPGFWDGSDPAPPQQARLRPPSTAKISHKRGAGKNFTVDDYAWYEESPPRESRRQILYRQESGRLTGELALPHVAKFNKARLFEYIDLCKSRGLNLTLWVQRGPTQHNDRFWCRRASHTCRMDGCPANGTIGRGHFQISLDENADLTGTRYDPFKVAGFFHLFCVERFVGLPELMTRCDVRPDTRTFQWEEKNPMSLNRDGPGFELEPVFKSWKRKHVDPLLRAKRTGRSPTSTPPLEKSEFLCRRLTIKLLSWESFGKTTFRRKRGGCDVSVHQGDLEKAVSGRGRNVAAPRQRRELQQQRDFDDSRRQYWGVQDDLIQQNSSYPEELALSPPFRPHRVMAQYTNYGSTYAYPQQPIFQAAPASMTLMPETFSVAPPPVVNGGVAVPPKPPAYSGIGRPTLPSAGIPAQSMVGSHTLEPGFTPLGRPETPQSVLNNLDELLLFEDEPVAPEQPPPDISRRRITRSLSKQLAAGDMAASTLTVTERARLSSSSNASAPRSLGHVRLAAVDRGVKRRRSGSLLLSTPVNSLRQQALQQLGYGLVAENGQENAQFDRSLLGKETLEDVRELLAEGNAKKRKLMHSL